MMSAGSTASDEAASRGGDGGGGGGDGDDGGGGDSGDGHLLLPAAVPANLTRDVIRAGGGHHSLVQVGCATRAAAQAGRGELGRSGEVAAVVRRLRCHQVHVVVAVVLEAQLVSHGNAV